MPRKVIHGGTIMAIMERFAKPAGSYYDYQAQNGRGFILNRDGSYEVFKYIPRTNSCGCCSKGKIKHPIFGFLNTTNDFLCNM